MRRWMGRGFASSWRRASPPCARASAPSSRASAASSPPSWRLSSPSSRSSRDVPPARRVPGIASVTWTETRTGSRGADRRRGHPRRPRMTTKNRADVAGDGRGICSSTHRATGSCSSAPLDPSGSCSYCDSCSNCGSNCGSGSNRGRGSCRSCPSRLRLRASGCAGNGSAPAPPPKDEKSSRDFTKAPPCTPPAQRPERKSPTRRRAKKRTYVYRENNRTIRFVPTTRVSRVP